MELRPRALETPIRAWRETLRRHSVDTLVTPRPSDQGPQRHRPEPLERLGRHSGDTVGLRPRASETLTRASRVTLGRHRGPPTQGSGDTDQSFLGDTRATIGRHEPFGKHSGDTRETPWASDSRPRRHGPELLGRYSGPTSSSQSASQSEDDT